MDVTREITLPLDREAAWETVTNLERWLVEESSLELEPGTAEELTLPGGEMRWATVDEMLAPEHLCFWWHTYDARATRVQVTFVEVPEGTRIVVVESGYASEPVCGPPSAGGAGWAGTASRARSAAAVTASPSLELGRAWILVGTDWEPALQRLRRCGEPVAA